MLLESKKISGVSYLEMKNHLLSCCLILFEAGRKTKLRPIHGLCRESALRYLRDLASKLSLCLRCKLNWMDQAATLLIVKIKTSEC